MDTYSAMNVVAFLHTVWPDLRLLLQLLIIVWGIRGCFLAIAVGRRSR